jgi:flavin-dependent dehydrogenase
VLHFGQTVTRMVPDAHAPRLTVRDETGAGSEITARFVLDASGFGRTLARLLDLETPVPAPPRMALFTHIKDAIAPEAFDRNKILISINPDDPQIWYWLIPLADGISSIGVVGEPQALEPYGPDRESRFAALIAAAGHMGVLVKDAPMLREIGEIKNYACKVSSLIGPGYALLGNAGEFLDPVFSSGLTIALKSASLAAGILDRQLRGADTDWQSEFCAPLYVGIDAFRSYVDAWYAGVLPRIIFNQPAATGKVKTMITAILAGYAWDETNPFARQPGNYLRMVDAACG